MLEMVHRGRLANSVDYHINLKTWHVWFSPKIQVSKTSAKQIETSDSNRSSQFYTSCRLWVPSVSVSIFAIRACNTLTSYGRGHSVNVEIFMWGQFFPFLCRLQSIATHRDQFVSRLTVHLSVRLSHFSVTLSKAMFRRRHINSSECCHYFLP